MLLGQIPVDTLQRMLHIYTLKRVQVCSQRSISFNIDSKLAVQFAAHHNIVSCTTTDIETLVTKLKEAYRNIKIGYASILISQHATYSHAIGMALPIRKSATDMRSFKLLTAKVLQTLHRNPSDATQVNENKYGLRFINDVTVLFSWYLSRLQLSDYRLIEQLLPSEVEIIAANNPLDYAIVSQQFEGVGVVQKLSDTKCLSKEFIAEFCTHFSLATVCFNSDIVASVKSKKITLKTSVFA